MLYVIMSRKCFTVFSVFIVLGQRNEYRMIWVLPGFWEILLNQNADGHFSISGNIGQSKHCEVLVKK